MILMNLVIGFTLAHANTETGSRIPQTEGYHQARARLSEAQPSSEDRTFQPMQYHVKRLQLTKAPEVKPVTPSTDDRRPQIMNYHLQILRLSEAGAPTSDVQKYHLEMLKALRASTKQASNLALDRQLGAYMSEVYRAGSPRTAAQVALIEQGACVVSAHATGADADKCGGAIKLGSCSKAVAGCVSEFVVGQLAATRPVTRVAEGQAVEAGR